MKEGGYDKATLEFIHAEITKLEVANWKLSHNKSEYSKGMNQAFRECVRILTSILNEEKIVNSV